MRNTVNPPLALDEFNKFIQGFCIADGASTSKDDELALGTGKRYVHSSPVLKEISDVVFRIRSDKGDYYDLFVAALKAVGSVDFNVGMVGREGVRKEFDLRSVN